MISKRNDERENYFFFLLYYERWVFNKLQANKKSLIINRLRMIWISCANKIPLRVCPNGNFIRVFRRFVLSGGVQTDRQGLSWWEVCNWLYSLSYRELPYPTPICALHIPACCTILRAWQRTTEPPRPPLRTAARIKSTRNTYAASASAAHPLRHSTH